MVRTSRRRAIAPDPLADDGEHDERAQLACDVCGAPSLGRIEGRPRCGVCCGGVDFDLRDPADDEE